jgi:hypothetical protein
MTVVRILELSMNAIDDCDLQFTSKCCADRFLLLLVYVLVFTISSVDRFLSKLPASRATAFPNQLLSCKPFVIAG